MILKDIKKTIADWDDGMSAYQFHIKIRELMNAKKRTGVKCWSCGTENSQKREICIKCCDYL